MASLPSRFRGEPSQAQSLPPTRINKAVTPLIQSLCKFAYTHPIHTIVIYALLASTSYIGLLQHSLASGATQYGRADWAVLSEGSRDLVAGPETSWNWQTVEPGFNLSDESDHLALLTFVFPDTLSAESAAAPQSSAVRTPKNVTVTSLPSTENSFTAYSQDSILAYSIDYMQAPAFLLAAQEIPHENAEEVDTHYGREKKTWIMKAAKVQTRSSLTLWFDNAWTNFIDLLKNAETPDIAIMVIGYAAMHLTFVSLFIAMRRVGSNFWLAMTTILSSTFAFLFSMAVTTHFLGDPVSVVILSEGLPFLVVVIGFDKNIALTSAVLSHAIEHRPGKAKAQKGDNEPSQRLQSTIQYAIRAAIKDQGYGIVREYLLEILVLSVGAASGSSGVRGGLQQFCFLAAWILFFDCILLFTFYVAILSIKLEINRIKRHVETRLALEADGVNKRIAENVAKSQDRTDAQSTKTEVSIFGRTMRSSSVPKFKVLMTFGFIFFNFFNIFTIPFRSPDSFSHIRSWSDLLGAVVSPAPVDPFKVASNGLDAVLAAAKAAGARVLVTVLTPIKYELQYPSVHYALPSGILPEDGAGAGFGEFGVGGRVVGSLLKSLEDPVLSKWIVAALALSVGLNGYLFNVARWSIKDPNVPDHQIDRDELARAQRFNETESATLPLGEYVPPTPQVTQPGTPVVTDDEDDALAMDKIAQPLSNRSLAELEKMLTEKRVHEMTDEEVVEVSMRGKLPGYALEKAVKDFTRAVKIRRTIISRTAATSEITKGLERSKLPYKHYDWERVHGACCENVVGYVPIPVGVAGPLVIDGKSYFIPMATTEGVLVASTSRGCKAINSGGGVVTVLTADGMTRGPCVSFEHLERAGLAKAWLDSDAGQEVMKNAFNSTSRFARLQSMKTAMAGTNLYIRFKTTTGDAMGMNMISKGCEHALNVMATEGGFNDMHIVSLSGNYCMDKKPAAINWIEGRGKSVVAEAIIPEAVVRSVLKTDVNTLVDLNMSKNMIGSAMAGSVGGFNAHAANIVAAMFIATGQDPAQVVESANCITIMKNLGGSLQISVSMPSLEVGTLGGGTILDPQNSMLDMLGVKGSHPSSPGENARRLARIIGAAVLAGELSLCSALAAGHLVKAHMAHNRSAASSRATNGATTIVAANGASSAAGSAAPSVSTSPAPTRSTTPVASLPGLSMTSGRPGFGSSTNLSAAAQQRLQR